MKPGILKDNVILIFSNEPWGKVWFSKQHYAKALSEHNKVFFVNPARRWKPSEFWRIIPQRKKIDEQLELIDYMNVLPFSGRCRWARVVNERIIAFLISRKIHHKHPVFLSFDPIRFTRPEYFKPAVSIYYNVDDHRSVKREKELASNVDAIFVVSHKLGEKMDLHREKMHFLPHGIQRNGQSIDALAEMKEKKQALFMGSIDHRFDFVTLLKLSEQVPEYDFVMVGNVNLRKLSAEDKTLHQQAMERPNIRFMGSLDYSELPPYIAESAICICNSKTARESETMNSLKILQYLSYGKKVVANYFDSYKDAPEGLICMADPGVTIYDIFVAEKDRCDSRETRLMRINYARNFEYPKLITEMDTFLQTRTGR